jgi:hypothetical protein
MLMYYPGIRMVRLRKTEKFEFPSRNLNLIRVYSLAGFQLLFQEATKSVPEPRLALN